jgi:PadR family transcriptional regulator AphA
MELSSTAHVILGMVDWRPMSGYEIKSMVDRSTRLFWTASYGQIYPELRRLAEAGLIEGKPSPQGGRKRHVYRPTPAGRKELRAWLGIDPEVFETRDEALLKLFFADSAGGRTAAATLDAKRRHHEEIVEYLRGIEASGQSKGFGQLVLRYGIELNEWSADWCERAKSELEQPDGTTRRAA